MASDDRAFLSRVADFAAGVPYPAPKAAVVAGALRGNVPSDVLASLLRLPEKPYGSVADVQAEVERLHADREQ